MGHEDQLCLPARPTRTRTAHPPTSSQPLPTPQRCAATCGRIVATRLDFYSAFALSDAARAAWKSAASSPLPTGGANTPRTSPRTPPGYWPWRTCLWRATSRTWSRFVRRHTVPLVAVVAPWVAVGPVEAAGWALEALGATGRPEAASSARRRRMSARTLLEWRPWCTWTASPRTRSAHLHPRTEGAVMASAAAQWAATSEAAAQTASQVAPTATVATAERQ